MKTVLLSFLLSFIYPPQPQNDFAEKYLEASRATMHGQSTEADVQKLTDLYHDDLIYEHPKFGIKLETKSVIEEGKLSFLKSYGGKVSDAKTRLINQISNGDTYILEFEIQFLTSKNEPVKRTQIQVLEMVDQKIKRIIDYW